MTGKRNDYEEGTYEASRKYKDATKRFVESGREEKAAADAAPRTREQPAQVKHAERAALLRAKETPPIREPDSPFPAIEETKPDSRLPDEIEAGAENSRSANVDQRE